MATRREIFNQLCGIASELYGEAEARQIAEMIVTHRGGISRNALIVEPNIPLEIDDLEDVKLQLAAWRPVQYILGVADFAGMELKVKEGVLIPRPETEELVEWVVSECGRGANILDVGTGSGAIAIAIARYVADSKVWAMDISEDALEVACRNVEEYAPGVALLRGDALKDFSQIVGESLDVVVSNPPYIPLSDKSLMRPNVVDHEPSLALYVPDDDPLIFYRSIARSARKMLRSGGRIYYEIYELLADEMCSMLVDEGYINIRLREDFRGKKRMICAEVE